MGSTNTKGIKRLINATGFSMAGFQAAWKNEAAFRQEISLALILVPVGLWLGTDATQKALLVGILFIVVITELLNSAIEAVIDRIGPEYHELSKRAKDMGSAAVFVSLSATVLIWGLIIYERIFS